MKLTAFIEGVGLGALTMFLLDPDRGGRRRALLRDQVVHQTNRKREALNVMGRDFINRSRGLRYRMRSRFDHTNASDEIIMERIKAELGRIVSHSKALQIECHDGIVTLSGPILAAEIETCLRHAQNVGGVKKVLNNMVAHAAAEHVPSLQGGLQAAVQERWSPATCLVMGATGLFCTIYGMGRKGFLGGAMQVGGVGLIAKAFHDTEHRFDPGLRKQTIALAGTGDNKRPLTAPSSVGAQPVTDRGQAGMA